DLARRGDLRALVARHWAPLLDDLGDAAGTDRAATLADGEPQALFHRDRSDELDGHLRVVPRHHHLDTAGQLDRAGDVRRAEVELGPVVAEERRVSPAFVLFEDLNLSPEVLSRRGAARPGQPLTNHHC